MINIKLKPEHVRIISDSLASAAEDVCKNTKATEEDVSYVIELFSRLDDALTKVAVGDVP